ncbi:hypothetical protein J1N35_024166 [Gossypium stocksii]|uniref:Uncharacterized protein n=1 Tax=Gossypium stocksii TaxID=47602 RepID=A0A9D3VJG3_9ROSI|nr:hypothetical protein J1N35_024166 [Gossypium stocksii]
MDCASIVNHFSFHKEDITILDHRIKEARKMLDSFVSTKVKWALSKCCNLSFEMDYPSDIHNIVIYDAT